ncbi:LysR family transcriptional regulator [Nocardia sp. NPDC059239]|uniref:helix-turn-helix domain-containing protein n=1 Tax=unclassified Nocardia TaxID=2637762 RepID=UPI00369E372C
MTDLDLAAVRAFVTAVDEGQFGYAAAVLGLTQQAVSKRIAKLEGQPAYPYALLWSTADPHPALPDLIDHVRQNYSADILADCWIPESDRTIFQP